MSSWLDIDTKLSLMLDDADKAQYPDAFRIVSFNLASDFFAQTHTAPLKSTLLSEFAGSGAVLSLPLDCMIVAGVEDIANKRFLTPVVIQGGYDSFTDGYIEQSDGVTVFTELAEGCRLWYYSFYSSVVDDTSIVQSPRFAEYALIMLAMSLLLNPDMLGEASLSRFDSSRDKGTPEQSAIRKQAQWYFEQYIKSLNGIPPQQRSFFHK